MCICQSRVVMIIYILFMLNLAINVAQFTAVTSHPTFPYTYYLTFFIKEE